MISIKLRNLYKIVKKNITLPFTCNFQLFDRKYVYYDFMFYFIFLETSPFPFTKMNLSDRQKLCKSVRNAQIFVDFNKWEKFPKWMTYVFPQIKGDNRRIHHYTTENDGHIFFFHQQFKNTELLHCDYGVSEIYLTEIVNPGNFYMLYWKGSDSEMLSNMASVVHILKSLPCNKNKSVDDLTIFQNTFQERVQGKAKNIIYQVT